jgi:hypothetical protein
MKLKIIVSPLIAAHNDSEIQSGFSRNILKIALGFEDALLLLNIDIKSNFDLQYKLYITKYYPAGNDAHHS